ncbi:MAG: valine--tRNA ligase [Actinomycetota bacterium]|nr:valine--tRNA ligase [Actinomycetota bacterium]
MAGLESRTRYEPAEVEPRISERWLTSGINHPAPEGAAEENYSIAVPPPNVTGALHMGHALNGSIQDVLIRFHRMRGRRAKWIFGTDHAGIATQKQVEQRLAGQGVKKEDLGRERFVEEVWAWTREHGGIIQNQFKRLGASLDYDDERFTLDEGYVEAVLRVFVDLYRKDLIYRDHYLVNWDPGLGTAVSDLEVEEREVQDTLYSIAYSDEIVVATVRPETMLGDTAVAVHPDDARYRHLIGTTVTLPLVGRELPVIADEYVKTDFGTGALKITPAHDPNDFEIGRRHGLPAVSVIDEDGRMTAEAGDFAGMTPLEAREAVVAALGDRVRATEPYTHNVPYSHRSGERIEPLISLQWFMRMDELARPAIDAVRDGRIRIHPESQARRYVDWLENIEPWCISRQLWWGHQIPVWYRGEEVYAGLRAPDGEGWEQDPDVLDTWFSSGLWPFATLGWPDDTPELGAFHPTDVLSTARDILFLWVARMVMLGLRFTGEIPFADVYCHSVIQAPDGRRMSKSLGTGIDPLDLIDRYGADATRFGLLAMSSSQDVRFSEEKIAQGAQLANKLFNASRLILTNVGEAAGGGAGEASGGAAPPTALEDRWILSRLERAKAAAAERIESFDFAKLALGLYDFVFSELCDWYLEMVKPRLYEGDAAAHATLLRVLEETLALAHPVIPFVTEELWSMLPGDRDLLAASRMAERDDSRLDDAAEAEVAAAIGAVRALRNWRESVDAKPGLFINGVAPANGTAPLVAQLARFAWAEGDPAVTVPTPLGPVGVLATDGLDLGAAERKLDAERGRLQKEIARAEGRLANEGFVAKAPAHVVDAEREKLDRLRAELEAL